MFLSLLKRQWKRTLLLILFFGAIMTIQTDATWETSDAGEYYPDQTRYLSGHDLTDRVRFAETLAGDEREAYALWQDIQLFVHYNGKVPEGELDEAALTAIATGGTPYMNYDMAVWRRNMLNSPGKYSKSLSQDHLMLRDLSNRLHYQLNLDSLLENNRELMSRAIRRGSSLTPWYETAQEELNAIKTDFLVTDTAFTVLLLEYLNTDWYILAILCLNFFGLFSTAAQQKITNQLLISKTGIRRYAACQVLAALTITAACLLIYYGIVVFACASSGPGQIAWDLPIQCVFGEHFRTDNIYYNMKVWEYFLLMAAVKLLFCLLLVSVLLLLSALSRNNLISGLLAVALCGSLILLREKGEWGGLLIGNGHVLLQELCYFRVNGEMVHYLTVYALSIALLIPVTVGLTVLLSKPAAKGWVK